MPNPIFPAPPFYSAGFGLSTEYGTFLPPGSRPIYVCSAGSSYGGGNDYLARFCLPTLAAGLAQCRSGLFDTVIVLPGHTENVTDSTMMANLVAGTRIVGFGSPQQDNAPVFTWTNTSGAWNITKKNVVIQGLRLLCDGANGITKAINVTAAGVSMRNNYIEWASGAALKATIGLEVGTGADDFNFLGNMVAGTETHNVTDGIKVVAAVRRLRICENEMIASATAANGLIHVTAAALAAMIRGNHIYNTHTSSTACIAVDDVAADGIVSFNSMGVKSNGTASSQGLTFGTSALMVAFENYCSDEPKKSGLLAPVAAT